MNKLVMKLVGIMIIIPMGEVDIIWFLREHHSLHHQIYHLVQREFHLLLKRKEIVHFQNGNKLLHEAHQHFHIIICTYGNKTPILDRETFRYGILLINCDDVRIFYDEIGYVVTH